jgi:uncharacterized protein (TIGR03435 family)
MVDLIATAYGVGQSYVQGGPNWLERDRFDVIAKAPAGTPPATLKLMLKSLLADRFKLVIHPGDKPLPAYVLSAGKGKPKLKEAEGSGEVECKDQEPPEKTAPDAVRQIVVAVIKPSKPDEDSIDVHNVPLRFLITFAWDLNPNDYDAGRST